MTKEFRLPRLGGVDEARTVLSILVETGEIITSGQPVISVSDRGMRLEIPGGIQGKVSVIHAKEGDSLLPGQLVLTIEEVYSPAATPAKPVTPVFSGKGAWVPPPRPGSEPKVKEAWVPPPRPLSGSPATASGRSHVKKEEPTPAKPAPVAKTPPSPGSAPGAIKVKTSAVAAATSVPSGTTKTPTAHAPPPKTHTSAVRISDTVNQAIEGAAKRMNLPSPSDLLLQKLESFYHHARTEGLAMAVDPWSRIKADLSTGKTDVSSFIPVMPELLAVGRLMLEKEGRSGEMARDLSTNMERHYIPALVRFRSSGGILFADKSETGARNAQLSILRLLLCVDPKLVELTVVASGSVHILNTLTPVLPALKHHEIVETREQIETRMQALRDVSKSRHIETLSRARVEWFYEFMRKHPYADDAYHIVVIPTGMKTLSEKAMNCLNLMLDNHDAARAGIYFIICDESAGTLKGGLPVIHAKSARSFELQQDRWLDTRTGEAHSPFMFGSDAAPADVVNALQDAIVKRANSSRAPAIKTSIPKELWWTGDTRSGLRVPIGKAGPDIQEFVLGEDRMVHNSLVGGAVGSGKTVLLHSIIVNAACLYSPQELRFHLLDYKDGTEFSIYRRLPHIETLSIGSSVDFGLDVLREFQAERKRRAERFKEAGVSKLADYRTATGEVLPRHVLIIDEFQVLWTDHRHGEEASRLLDDLVRLGRSFGFNIILSTQSLRGVMLGQATRSQIGLRVCMRLSESDCDDFLGQSNAAPSRLTRVGAAIYNEDEGAREGNRTFQVSFLNSRDIDGTIESLCAKALKLKQKTNSPEIYEVENFEDMERLSEGLSAGNLILGRKAGLRGETVFFQNGQLASRAVLVLGQSAQKIDVIMNSFGTQLLKQGRRAVELVDDPAPGLENVGSIEEEHSRWKEWVSADFVDASDKPCVYFIRQPRQSRELRKTEVQETFKALAGNHSIGGVPMFFIFSDSIADLSYVGLYENFFECKLFLDSATLVASGGRNLSLNSTEVWMIGGMAGLGGMKVKLAENK